MQLKDSVIAITGAAGGLGRAMAVRLARCGAKTALLDMDEEGLEQTREQCEQAGATSRGYPLDITQEDQVVACFQKLIEDFGGLHGIINNAGVTADGLLVKAKDGKVEKKLSLEDWDKVSKIDMRGVFLCAREAAARMIEHVDAEAPEVRGVILNISSISRSGNVGQTNYAAAKSGVEAMTVTWANELSRHGIRVAAIAPGFCETAMVEKMPRKALDKLKASIPFQRLGKPEEIAHAAQFVMENDYFHGRVLEVDGGLRL
ncbi:3-oxoacyl-[acyl-carrier protein] reductase [Modicisalibacter ilicicola DSM 19980]|uniref:3-oxoacyl-[acyl-carrier protein] reductase n=1 Tax=Modicisalibacter ilicicola DSM 19980 TaxID=1121942 RepID=A0A1M5EKE0_9GAMM|nr:SDR family oxidoreductase [Halomonas ilicicola]SHF79709.1 3-oxoacyl-[acyl-carrier protein] reductase [Halomonas ilicicola DSM 19980]